MKVTMEGSKSPPHRGSLTLCLKWIFSPPSTCFQFPALNIFGNEFVCLFASLLNHCLPPKVRVQHVLITTKSSTHHSSERHGVSHVSEQSERSWEQLCFLLPLLDAFCLYFQLCWPRYVFFIDFMEVQLTYYKKFQVYNIRIWYFYIVKSSPQ